MVLGLWVGVTGSLHDTTVARLWEIADDHASLLGSSALG